MKTDHFAAKARFILERFGVQPGQRAPKGALDQITRAAGGTVTGYYLYQLSKGRIKNPGADKLEAIAAGLHFPVNWWWDPIEVGPPPIQEPEPSEGNGEVAHLVEQIKTLTPDQQRALLKHLQELLPSK